jgi:hypothetical protein
MGSCRARRGGTCRCCSRLAAARSAPSRGDRELIQFSRTQQGEGCVRDKIQDRRRRKRRGRHDIATVETKQRAAAEHESPDSKRTLNHQPPKRSGRPSERACWRIGAVYFRYIKKTAVKSRTIFPNLSQTPLESFQPRPNRARSTGSSPSPPEPSWRFDGGAGRHVWTDAGR